MLSKRFFYWGAACVALLYASYQLLPVVSSLFKADDVFRIQVAKHGFGEGGQEPLVSLGDIDKPKIVILWTLGCLPCFQTLIKLNKLSELIRDKGVEIMPIYISYTKERPEVRWGSVVVYFERSIRQGLSWKKLFPHLTPYYDSLGKVFSAIDVKATPLILFLGKKNKIIYRKEGLQNWDKPEGEKELLEMIEKIKAVAS